MLFSLETHKGNICLHVKNLWNVSAPLSPKTTAKRSRVQTPQPWPCTGLRPLPVQAPGPTVPFRIILALSSPRGVCLCFKFISAMRQGSGLVDGAEVTKPSAGPAATQTWKYFPFKTEIKRLLRGHSKTLERLFQMKMSSHLLEEPRARSW